MKGTCSFKTLKISTLKQGMKVGSFMTRFQAALCYLTIEKCHLWFYDFPLYSEDFSIVCLYFFSFFFKKWQDDPWAGHNCCSVFTKLFSNSRWVTTVSCICGQLLTRILSNVLFTELFATISIAKKFAAEQLAHVRLFAKCHDRVEMSICEKKFYLRFGWSEWE